MNVFTRIAVALENIALVQRERLAVEKAQLAVLQKIQEELSPVVGPPVVGPVVSQRIVFGVPK